MSHNLSPAIERAYQCFMIQWHASHEGSQPQALCSYLVSVQRINLDFARLTLLPLNMGRAKVPFQKKTEVKGLLQTGVSQLRIPQSIGVSQKYVSGVAKKLKENKPLTNDLGQGRKKESIEAIDRNLVRLCKKDRTESSEILSAEFVLSTSEHLSARTMHRRLLGASYISYTAKRKSSRKPKHR